MVVFVSGFGVLLCLATVVWGAVRRKWSTDQHLSNLKSAPNDLIRLDSLEALRPAIAQPRVRMAVQAETQNADPQVKNKATDILQQPLDDYSKPLTSIMPKWAVVGVALACFVFVISAIYLAVFRSELFGSPMSRFGLIFAASLFLGVFFFVFYPMKIDVPIPGLDKATRLAGPLAVFFFMWGFLDARMPSGVVDRLYYAYEKNAVPDQFVKFADVANLDMAFPPDTVIHPVIGTNGKDVIGVIVRFPAAIGNNPVEGKIMLPFRDPTSVSLTRFHGDDFVRLNPLKNK